MSTVAPIAAPASVTVPTSASVTTRAARIGSGVQITRLTPEQELGEAALASIAYPWRQLLPGWTISFRPSRGGFLGMTFRPERRIEIYVRLDRPVNAVAHDIAHELGHAIDVTHLNDERRARYLELRGLKADTAWWACNSCRDLKTGAGDFAETFAWWTAPRYRFYGVLAPAPSDEILALMAADVFPRPVNGADG
jgi:hypothetical protein